MLKPLGFDKKSGTTQYGYTFDPLWSKKGYVEIFLWKDGFVRDPRHMATTTVHEALIHGVRFNENDPAWNSHDAEFVRRLANFILPQGILWIR